MTFEFRNFENKVCFFIWDEVHNVIVFSYSKQSKKIIAVFNADSKSSNMITEKMYEIEIPIIVEKNLATYEYDSFASGYRAYMDIWNPLIGEILKCK